MSNAIEMKKVLKYLGELDTYVHKSQHDNAKIAKLLNAKADELIAKIACIADAELSDWTDLQDVVSSMGFGEDKKFTIIGDTVKKLVGLDVSPEDVNEAIGLTLKGRVR